MAPCRRAKTPRHLGAEHALQRQRLQLDDGHLGAAPRGRPRRPPGRSSPAPTMTTRGRRRPGRRAVGVGERAQVEHAVQVGAGHGSRRGVGAGRQQQPVVGALARRRPASAGAPRVESRGRGRRCAARPRARRTSRRGARRRSRGRPCRAGSPWTAAAARTAARPRADQDDRAVEAFVAQGLGGLGAGQAGADDHNCSVMAFSSDRECAGEGEELGAGAGVRAQRAEQGGGDRAGARRPARRAASCTCARPR